MPGLFVSFEMAAEVFSRPSATVLVQDDVAVESSTFSTSRRGVAGTLVVEKIVGAAAEAGADLASCAAAFSWRVARAGLENRRIEPSANLAARILRKP